MHSQAPPSSLCTFEYGGSSAGLFCVICIQPHYGGRLVFLRSIDSYFWLLSFSYSYIMEFTYFMLYIVYSVYIKLDTLVTAPVSVIR